MPSPSAPGPAATPQDATPAVPCPECGSALTTDPRFIRWCPSCGWNAHPGASAATTRGDRFGRRINRAAEARLFRRITESGRLRSSRDGAWLAATGLATLVHLVTLAMGASGVLLIVLVPHALPALVVGAVLILCTIGLRPRLGTMRTARRAMHLDRPRAPALYGLADRIAAELGTPPVKLICFDRDHNASYRRVGLRQRPVLTIGMPLWETLSVQERVAMLGHELGHGANGDTAQSLWVGAALRSLDEWYSVMTPGRRLAPGQRSTTGSAAALGEMVARVLMFVFAEAVLQYHRLLLRVTVLGSRRAEYLADSMAARVGGSAATATMLEHLTLGRAVEQVRRQRSYRGKGAPRRRRDEAPAAPEPLPDFWVELRDYVDSIPASERQRRLRVSELDDSATDTTHPPTHLRIAFARQQPQPDPLIVPTAEELAAVEAELAPVRRAVAAALE